MTTPLIRTFSYHYREKYGHGVGKVPIDMGQRCPNRQKGGCIFCSPESFTPSHLLSTDGVEIQIEKGKKNLLDGRFQKYFGYFQQESCTAVNPDELYSVLQKVLADHDCVGAILSTRPDCVDDALLDSLVHITESTGKEILFELGIQTVHQRSLDFLNRNHTFADFQDAVIRIQQKSCFEIGAHLIFGIPGESRYDMLASVKTVCGLGVNALKLHHLQVIKNTPLCNLYSAGSIDLFSREEYQEFLLQVLPLIPSTVTLHRLWATAHPKQLVAPRWNCLTSVLSKLLYEQMQKEGIYQGRDAR
jgi:radical SAM protein (TIGR01212 family)